MSSHLLQSPHKYILTYWQSVISGKNLIIMSKVFLEMLYIKPHNHIKNYSFH